MTRPRTRGLVPVAGLARRRPHGVRCPRAATQTSGEDRAAPGFPVTVENSGRQLMFEARSEVVTGYHPVFATMVELGLGDRTIGRSNLEENGPAGSLPGHKVVYDRVPEISDDIELPQKEVLIA